MNISVCSLEETARTCLSACAQRAEHLAVLGVESVIELCVGPSLRDLELAYRNVGIQVTGNDIDARWRDYHPTGRWIIGDASKIDVSGFDAVVVAPPLSRGCSGRRADYLSLEEVVPSYYDFSHLTNKVVVYVLPGKTLSIKGDRRQLHRFLSRLTGTVNVIPIKNKVTKYLDVYVCGMTL